MRLSYKWLSEYVDLNGITPLELAERMTKAGLEVEAVEPFATGSDLVIGEVISCEEIEGTHLKAARVNIGTDDPLDIVCGAPNCRAGIKVIVARAGAKLPGGTITAKPLRGYASNGMLCALFELGVDKKWLRQDQIDGIEELSSDAPVGEEKVLEYLGLDDTVLDVSLTPNRSDCLSMWNMAKEVGAVLRRKVTWPDYEGKADIGEKSSFKVATATPNCSCYYGKVVNHVKVGPSPSWMVRYLNAAGVNSINNVVDISNFVMLETGQPLHYYNLAKLPAKEITVVDDIKTKMVALDGVEFDIEKGDLLITTGGQATGVAGIMGGEESMIDESTDSIFIEAAHFDMATIRRTSIRLNLLTEAAQRFAKGLEICAMKKGVDRSVQLLREYAEAAGFEETLKAGDDTYVPVTVTETLSHCNELLGTEFTQDQVSEVLTALDFQPEQNGEAIICHIPSYRIDIERPADIDEEIIRLIGYDGLKSTLPVMVTTSGRLSEAQKERRHIRQAFKAYGLHEIVTYTLVGRDYIDDGCIPMDHPVELAMPMSEARRYVRSSLMNSVLSCVRYNEAHQNTRNNFFELSKVFGAGAEEERLAVVLDGEVQQDRLHHVAEKGDFYALKGMLVTWLEKTGFSPARISVKENKTDTVHFHPYRSGELWLDKTRLGVFGQVHPSYAEKFDLKNVVYAEIRLDPVFAARKQKLKFTPLNPYPAVSRDIAMIVDKDVSAARLSEALRKAGRRIIRSYELFDIYEGEKIGADKKSVALRVVYQADDHTLNDEEIGDAHQAVIEALRKFAGAVLRD